MSEQLITGRLTQEVPQARPAALRALIVEDDPAIRALTAAVLRREGFVVDLATNGREAMPLLRQSHHDVIVLDLSMPEMSGIELLEYLGHSAPQTLRRVVVMTAAVHSVQHGLPHDICRIITKPFELTDFVAAVDGCSGAGDR